MQSLPLLLCTLGLVAANEYGYPGFKYLNNYHGPEHSKQYGGYGGDHSSYGSSSYGGSHYGGASYGSAQGGYGSGYGNGYGSAYGNNHGYGYEAPSYHGKPSFPYSGYVNKFPGSYGFPY